MEKCQLNMISFLAEKIADESPKEIPKVPVADVNKWAGEDEDDDIKVSSYQHMRCKEVYF